MDARWILGIGWGVFVLCAYPGVLDVVALEQLREGRAWELTDRHSPAMSALWGVAEHIVSGPIVLLVVQSLLLLFGLFAVLRRAMPDPLAAAGATVVLLFPPVLATAMVVGADTLMTGCLLIAVSCLTSERRTQRFAGLAWCTAAVALRLAAIAAALPLIVVLFDTGAPGRKRYAAAGIAWLAVAVVGIAIDFVLTQHHVHGGYAWAAGEADVWRAVPVHMHSIAQFTELKEVGLAGGVSKLHIHVAAVLRGFASHTPLLRPIVYAAVALALLPLARRHRDVLALLVSGLALACVVLASSPSAYGVVTACTGGGLLLARRRASR